MDNIDALISSLNSVLATPEFYVHMSGRNLVNRGPIGFFRSGDEIKVGFLDYDSCKGPWVPKRGWADVYTKGLVLEFVKRKDAELYEQSVALMQRGDVDMGENQVKTWICTVCGCEYPFPELPKQCPCCGADAMYFGTVEK